MSVSIIPEFYTTPWYGDPSDHRCPHDSWLESIDISEPSEGKRNEIRSISITIQLLGAYHDGYIVYKYSRVSSYSITSPSPKGHGDWLEDDITISDSDTLKHTIKWCQRAEKEFEWTITAKNIEYKWNPING